MLTQEFLRSVLSYDEHTCVFTWVKPPPHLVRLVGHVAGSKREDGYIRIYIGGKRYYAHRLAWLYAYGEYPKVTDHINQDKSDNRLTNLRSVTAVLNMRNRKRSSNNTSGAVGVVFSKRDGRWVAQIHMHDKGFYLGAFDNKEDAIAVRQDVSLKNEFTERHV